MANHNAAVTLQFSLTQATGARVPTLRGAAAVPMGRIALTPAALRSRNHYAAVVLSFAMGMDLDAYGNSLTGAGALTAREVVGDVLRLWGCSCDTDDFCIQTDAVAVVNAALQFIHANGRELPYLTKRRRAVHLFQNVTVVELDADVQHINGGIRVENMAYKESVAILPAVDDPLDPRTPFFTGCSVFLQFTLSGDTREIEFAYGTHYTTPESLRQAIQSRVLNAAVCYVHYKTSSLVIAFDIIPEMYVSTFTAGPRVIAADLNFRVYDGAVSASSSALSPNVTSGTVTQCHSKYEAEQSVALYGADAPPMCYVERTHNPVSDSTRIFLHLLNLADDAFVGMDVAVEPGRVSWTDVRTAGVIPIPHRYVESILMPVARYRATASHRYRQRERHEAVLAQYKEALDMLGIVDPQTSPVKDGKEADAP